MNNLSQSDVESFLPLNPVVFQILLVLMDREQHGYSLVKQIEQMAGTASRIQPGNLYRSLRTMRDQGLIEETDWRPDPEMDDDRRRYFCVTDLGRAVAREEASRLEQLVVAARSRDLLNDPDSLV